MRLRKLFVRQPPIFVIFFFSFVLLGRELPINIAIFFFAPVPAFDEEHETKYGDTLVISNDVFLLGVECSTGVTLISETSNRGNELMNKSRYTSRYWHARKYLTR